MAQYTNIMRTVTQQRKCLLGEAGEYQFAFFSVWENFAGIRIDNFCEKMILVDVHSMLFFTFERNARSAGFSFRIMSFPYSSLFLLSCPDKKAGKSGALSVPLPFVLPFLPTINQ